MAAKERPEWLPEGWTVEVNTTENGTVSSLYTCLESGCKFHSKEEVISYINNKKADGCASSVVSSFGDNKSQLAEPVQDSLNWLPTGWISETRIRKSGAAAGRPYKIFIDPLTSSRFYSKREVFRHLQIDNLRSSTTKNIIVNSVGSACTPINQTRSSNRKCTDYVIVQTESGVDGLPHGWLKEVRYRKGRGKIKKDPYYIDPVSGYAFRSLKDVSRYIKTGDIGKCIMKPLKRSTNDAHNFAKDSHPSSAESKSTIRGMAVKRCLFSPGTLHQVEMGMEISTQKGAEQANHLEKEKVEEIPSNSMLNPTCHATQAPQRILGTGKDNMSESVTRGSAVPANYNSSEALYEVHLEASSEHMQLSLVDNKLHETAEMTSSVQENINPIPLEIESIPASGFNKPSEGLLMELKNMEHSHPKKRGRKPKRRARISKSMLKEPQLELKTEDKVLLGKRRRGRPLGWRKINAVKAITMPLRASKRLAALKADRVANAGDIQKPSNSTITLTDQLQENPGKKFNLNDGSLLLSNQQKGAPTTELSEKLEYEEPLGEQANPEKKIELGGLIMGKPESSLSSLFGDSWPDPCIEFAFKTLIGDIPVLENAAVVEDYFHQQPGSNKGSTLDCAASTYKVPKSVGYGHAGP
ncbi:uncharacterized protein [Typha angustifolia]|uniref:uncharacterized protein isoform X2 n=1 Tax=Typha angustifolia TaxID=59011 RepID=UPI003C30E096